MKRDVSSLYKGNGVRVHHGNKEQWSESGMETIPWNGMVFLLYSGAVEWHVRVMLYIKSVSPSIILDSKEELC